MPRGSALPELSKAATWCRWREVHRARCPGETHGLATGGWISNRHAMHCGDIRSPCGGLELIGNEFQQKVTGRSWRLCSPKASSVFDYVQIFEKTEISFRQAQLSPRLVDAPAHHPAPDVGPDSQRQIVTAQQHQIG